MLGNGVHWNILPTLKWPCSCSLATAWHAETSGGSHSWDEIVIEMMEKVSILGVYVALSFSSTLASWYCISDAFHANFVLQVKSTIMVFCCIKKMICCMCNLLTGMWVKTGKRSMMMEENWPYIQQLALLHFWREKKTHKKTLGWKRNS